MPPAIRAKAMTASATLWAFGMPLGLFIAGPALAAFGARPVLIGFAAAQTLAMGGVALVSLRERARGAPEPVTGMSIGKGSYFRRYWIGEACRPRDAHGQIALSTARARADRLAGEGGAARVRPLGRLVRPSLPAGAIVDRIDRAAADDRLRHRVRVAMAMLVAALAAGTLTYGQLLRVALLQGVFAVFFKIAEVGAVRHLVDGRRPADGDRAEHRAGLGRLARRAAARRAALRGAPLAAVRRSTSSRISCRPRCSLSIRKPFHETREPEPWSCARICATSGSGVRWVWSQPFLRTATLLVGGANFVSNAVSLLLVVVVRSAAGLRRRSG